MLGIWFQLSPFTVKHARNENEFDHDVWKGKEIILKIKYVVQLCLKRRFAACLYWRATNSFSLEDKVL